MPVPEPFTINPIPIKVDSNIEDSSRKAKAEPMSNLLQESPPVPLISPKFFSKISVDDEKNEKTMRERLSGENPP